MQPNFGGPRNGTVISLPPNSPQMLGGWSFDLARSNPGLYTVWAEYQSMAKDGHALAKSNELQLRVPPATQPAAQVLPSIEALKADVVKLSKDYPQLAGAKDVAVTADGWLFTRDYREMGKGGYEDTGPFPLGVGLRIMPIAEFQQRVEARQMSLPGYRWEGLGLVGWVVLHTVDATPGELGGTLQKALHDVLAKIGEMNRQAFDARLPEEIKRQRAELLAKADADIRDSVQKLAEQFPQLRKGQPWDRLAQPSEPGRIGIFSSSPPRRQGQHGCSGSP